MNQANCKGWTCSMVAGRAAAALTLALALSAAAHAAPAQSVDDGLVYLEGGTVWIGSP